MVSQDRWLLPEGIEEVLPDEARELECLRRDLVDLFGRWGYELVIPPLVEFLESLLTGKAHDLDLETFKVTDQLSGRLMGIRADMTPQVARIDAHHLKRDVPTRLCYLGTVLHTRGDHLEKSRSPLQIGAELYGHGGMASDLEVIRLMLEVLAIAGLQEVHLDLGHVGIYRGLARQAGLTEEQELELFDALQRKAGSELGSLLERYGIPRNLREMLASLAEFNGSPGVLDKARDVLAGADPAVHAALADLEGIVARLQAGFPALPIYLDLAELHGYHYKTGMVFAAFVPGYGREVARGGRYDDIGRAFGLARPATGFSADLKVLARLGTAGLETESGSVAVFAPFSEDRALQERVRDLRAGGRRVIEELPGQAGDALALGCGERLERQNGQWVIVPVQAMGE